MTDDEWQTEEELEAHYGANGPVVIARQFIESALHDEDLDTIWPITDQSLRRALVGAWADANDAHPLLEGFDREELVEALSVDEPDHELWEGFADTQLCECRGVWAHVELDKWGFASRPRPIDIDVELVLLIKGDGSPTVYFDDGPTLVETVPFVMRHTESGWRVAGLTDPTRERTPE